MENAAVPGADAPGRYYDDHSGVLARYGEFIVRWNHMDQTVRNLLIFHDPGRVVAEATVYQMSISAVVNSLKTVAGKSYSGKLLGHYKHAAEYIDRLNAYRNIFVHSVLMPCNTNELFAQSFKARGEMKIHQSAISQAFFEVVIDQLKELQKFLSGLIAILMELPISPKPSPDTLEQPALPDQTPFHHSPI